MNCGFNTKRIHTEANQSRNINLCDIKLLMVSLFLKIVFVAFN